MDSDRITLVYQIIKYAVYSLAGVGSVVAVVCLLRFIIKKKKNSSGNDLIENNPGENEKLNVEKAYELKSEGVRDPSETTGTVYEKAGLLSERTEDLDENTVSLEPEVSPTDIEVTQSIVFIHTDEYIDD